MGGGGAYLIPAPYTGMSSWAAHHRRVPPSSEPGTDYYMPRGTTLRAPVAGRVVAVGGGVQPATGRFVVIDDGERWLRFLHLLRQDCHVGQDLERGEPFAISGASGYGSEHFGAASDTDPAMIARTGGPHVHVTAFRGRGYTFGLAGTVDFHAFTGGQVAGGGSTPGPTTPLPKGSSKMTIYARRDTDGLIVAIPEGGKTHNYTSVEEYERHRATVDVINGQRQAMGDALISRPPLLSGPAGDLRVIVTMTPEKLNDLIKSQGAFS